MANGDMVLAQEKALSVALAGSLVSDWLAFEELHNDASSATVKTYERGFRVFGDWLEGRGLDLGHVTPVDVVEFKADLATRYSPQTVNVRLTAVRRFYAWAVETGRAAFNPATVRGVKRSKSRTHKRDALTNGEVRRVLAQPDPETIPGVRDLAMMALMAYCGIRSVEVRRANIGDLRTRGDRLTLDVMGKGRVERDEYVVIPPNAESAVRDWLALRRRLDWAGLASGDPLFVSCSNRSHGERLTLRAIRDQVKRHYNGAGVAGDKSTHSLRHSFITNAIRRGASPMQVQSAARHQSFDTTLGYFHETSRLDNPAEDLVDYGD